MYKITGNELTDDFLLSVGWVKNTNVEPGGWGVSGHEFINGNKALRYINYIATGEVYVGYQFYIDGVECQVPELYTIADYYKYIGIEYTLYFDDFCRGFKYKPKKI